MTIDRERELRRFEENAQAVITLMSPDGAFKASQSTRWARWAIRQQLERTLSFQPSVGDIDRVCASITRMLKHQMRSGL